MVQRIFKNKSGGFDFYNSLLKLFSVDAAGNLTTTGTMTSSAGELSPGSKPFYIGDAAVNTLTSAVTWTDAVNTTSATKTSTGISPKITGRISAILQTIQPTNTISADSSVTSSFTSSVMDVANGDTEIPVSLNLTGITTNGYIAAAVEDGLGNLYIGGSFTVVNGVLCNNLAKINLETLAVFPILKTNAGTIATFNGVILALAYDSIAGKLYIGGQFTSINTDTAINRIVVATLISANIFNFNSMGSGCSSTVHALIWDSANSRLYVGGNFTTANSVTVSYVTYWNGTTFVNIGSGTINSTVYALALDSTNSRVYIGGSSTYGSSPKISYWDMTLPDGSSFIEMGVGCNGTVYTLAWDSANSRLYLGGAFTTANNVTVNYIAYWNGTTFVALGSPAGFDSVVYKIDFDVVNNRLYCLGGFVSTGSTYVGKVVYWSGSSWVSCGLYPYSVTASACVIKLLSNNRLLLGTNTPTSYTSIINIPLYAASIDPSGSDTSVGYAVAGAGGATINATAIDGSGNLYLGGSFDFINGTPCKNIAKINIATKVVTALGTGCDSNVYALAWDSTNSRLYVGGEFTLANGVTNTIRVAYWNGTTFVAMGTGCDSTVYAVAVDSVNNRVYVGGMFTLANGVTNTIRVAYWNGTTFVAMGTGCNGSVRAITVVSSNNRVYLGGDFTTANSVSVNRITYWNGTTFIAMGSGCDGGVSALAWDSTNSRLYIGGSFPSAGGVSNTAYITYWNGTTYVAMGTGMGNTVTSLAWASSLSKLFIGGPFSAANGLTMNKIASWNGSSFAAVDNGCNERIYAMTWDATNSKLHIGGTFTTVPFFPIPRTYTILTGNTNYQLKLEKLY